MLQKEHNYITVHCEKRETGTFDFMWVMLLEVMSIRHYSLS